MLMAAELDGTTPRRRGQGGGVGAAEGPQARSLVGGARGDGARGGMCNHAPHPIAVALERLNAEAAAGRKSEKSAP